MEVAGDLIEAAIVPSDGVLAGNAPFDILAQPRADCGCARSTDSAVARSMSVQAGREVAGLADGSRSTNVLLSPAGYPSDLTGPTQGTAIEGHNDENQRALQRGTLGAHQERYREAELR